MLPKPYQMEINLKTISSEFSEGNFKFCYNYFALDIEWRIVGNTILKGKENVISYCEKMYIEMAGSKLINTNLVLEKNKVVIEGTCRFTDGDNNPGEVAYCDLFNFDDGKIKTITSYCI